MIKLVRIEQSCRNTRESNARIDFLKQLLYVCMYFKVTLGELKIQ